MKLPTGLSDTALLAIVAAVPPTLLALATLVVSLRNSKKVEEVHKATNSMKDALVLTTEKEALARGIKKGAEDEKARSQA